MSFGPVKSFLELKACSNIVCVTLPSSPRPPSIHGGGDPVRGVRWWRQQLRGGDAHQDQPPQPRLSVSLLKDPVTSRKTVVLDGTVRREVHWWSTLAMLLLKHLPQTHFACCTLFFFFLLAVTGSTLSSLLRFFELPALWSKFVYCFATLWLQTSLHLKFVQIVNKFPKNKEKMQMNAPFRPLLLCK